MWLKALMIYYHSTVLWVRNWVQLRGLISIKGGWASARRFKGQEPTHLHVASSLDPSFFSSGNCAPEASSLRCFQRSYFTHPKILLRLGLWFQGDKGPSQWEARPWAGDKQQEQDAGSWHPLVKTQSKKRKLEALWGFSSQSPPSGALPPTWLDHWGVPKSATNWGQGFKYPRLWEAFLKLLQILWDKHDKHSWIHCV